MNVHHLIRGCTQFAYLCQTNLIGIAHHLEPLAKIVMGGIILRVNNGAFTVGSYCFGLVFYFIQELTESDEQSPFSG